MIDFLAWKEANHSETGVIGQSDCCLALADWALANGYADGASDLRGTYQDEQGMYSAIAEYGDLVDTVSHCAEVAGVPVGGSRTYGCLAVIGSTSNVYRQYGAIWDGSHWNVRLKSGFVHLTARPLKIWKV